MNKTLTINLSGLVFHIDENAYDVLRGYLEKLKRRFTGNSGEEIITDIEARIAEMFQEKISAAKNVITLDDVNSVISIMGNPEDIAGEEPGQAQQEQGAPASYTHPRKRLYRNPDDKMLAGVCGGIGAYLDVDPVWFRLAFALAVILAGTGVWVYIVLWIVIPMAKTASEKLEMRGEPINISNLEKNIKSEMENVKEQMNKLGEKIKSHDGGRQVRDFASKTGGAIKDVVGYLVKFILGIIGLIISLFSIGMLIFLTVIIFSIIGWLPSPVHEASHNFFHTVIASHNLWAILTGIAFLVGVPLIILMLNGIKLLFRINIDLKRVGLIMLMFWLIGVLLCAWQGVTVYQQFSAKATVSSTQHLQAFNNKILRLKVNKIAPGRYEWNDDDEKVQVSDGMLTFTEKNDSIMCSSIRISVEASRNDSVYLLRTYSSRGENPAEAHELANDINYTYALNDSSIILNNAFNIHHEEKFRGQAVHLHLKIPVGYKIILDKSMKEVEMEADNISGISWWDMAGHTWEMTPDGLKCLDCSEMEKKTQNDNIKMHVFKKHTIKIS